MNIRDRLMSRASVAAMAVFSPDGLPAGAERVDEAVPGGGADSGDLDSLSPEEMAQFESMRGGQVPEDKGNVDTSGDEGGEGDADPDADGGEGDVPDGDAGAGDTPDAGAGDRRDAQGGEKRTPKTINYGRHQKEMAKAQKDREDLQAKLAAVEKERNEERERRTRLDERTKLLLEAINTKQPAPAAAAPVEDKDPEPDADADPLGHVQWENRQLRKRMDDIVTGRQKDQEAEAATREERELYGTFSASIEQAARTDPEFADAFVHLRETRFRELGFIYADIDITDTAQCATLTDQQQSQLSQKIQQAFYNEQLMVAQGAIQSGKNPASVVKNLARARGFAGKPADERAAAPPAGDPPPAARNGRDAAPPPARRDAPPPSVTDQLEQIRGNMKDSKSLSDAGGAPGGEITLERIADMPPEEFEEFLAASKGKLDRMLGKVPM